MQQTAKSGPLNGHPATGIQNPWWAYLFLAGTNVLGQVLASRVAAGRDNQTDGGVRIERTSALQPSIDPERITATTVIGCEVKGNDHKPLGKIQEIAMDFTTGRIKYLVLAAGGFLGIGDRFYAVPLPALTFIPEERVFRLETTRKELQKTPPFDKMNWPHQALWQAGADPQGRDNH